MTSRNDQALVAAMLLLVVLVGLGIGFLMPRQNSLLSDKLAVQNNEDRRKPDPSELASQPSGSPPNIALSHLDIHDQLQRPCLASDGKGNVWLAWESRTAERNRTVFLARSTDDGQTFDEARPVRTTAVFEWDAMIRGRPARRATRMWPHLRFASQQLILSWVESGSDDPSEQLLMYARSNDLGESFGLPTRLSSQSAVRPGFVGFAAGHSGEVAAAWLDHRNDAQQPFAASSLSTGIDQLVYPGPNDAGICPCCELAVEFTASGDTIIAFRNSFDGFRDMWVSIRTADQGQFAAPIPVVAPRWEFSGCPHDGPSMTVVGDRLHIVWMDSHTGIQQVYRAQATIGEWRFETQPISPTNTVQAHPSVAADGDQIWIVWDESTFPAKPASPHSSESSNSSGSAVFMVKSTDRGLTWSPRIEVSPPNNAYASRPVLVSGSRYPVVAWTSLSENGKQIVAGTLDPGASNPLQIGVARDEQ